MISGIITAILLVGFLGLIGWAWSKRRKTNFNEAANLPLEEDHREREPRE